MSAQSDVPFTYTITVEHQLDLFIDGTIFADLIVVTTTRNGQFYDIKTFYNDELEEGQGRDASDVQSYIDDLKDTYNITDVTYKEVVTHLVDDPHGDEAQGITEAESQAALDQMRAHDAE